MLIAATLESAAAPEGAAGDVPDSLHAAATTPNHSKPQQATRNESKAGRLRSSSSWTGCGYVEHNASSTESVVSSIRAAREDRIGPIKGHVCEGSNQQISRSV